jgi:hypothetical protein
MCFVIVIKKKKLSALLKFTSKSQNLYSSLFIKYARSLIEGISIDPTLPFTVVYNLATF